IASAQHEGKPSEAKENDSTTEYTARYTRDKWLVILDAEHDFYSAKREAERVSKLSDLSISMEGMAFDRHRGLILQPKGDDAPDAGGYIARRYNEDAENPHGFISIERSDGYPGLKKGLYIVVGAICSSPREAESKISKFTKFTPSAYVAKNEI